MWPMTDALFLEHFAVNPALRSQGLGGRILEELKKQTDCPLVLEAELPETDWARRRLGFYARHRLGGRGGFALFPAVLSRGGQGPPAAPAFLPGLCLAGAGRAHRPRNPSHSLTKNDEVNPLNKPFEFELLHVDKYTGARRGRLHTPHGVIEHAHLHAGGHAGHRQDHDARTS